MIFQASVQGSPAELSVDKEGLRLGKRFLDYADLAALTPWNHRVLLDTAAGERIEISMLGFSFDGFWKDLTDAYAARTREALFLEGAPLMSVEGDYRTPLGAGRGTVELYPDAVVILPPNRGAVRIPLCFATDLRPEGYRLTLTTVFGGTCEVGRMGYDTQPFAARTLDCAAKTKARRTALLAAAPTKPPFDCKGLFRTTQEGLSWCAAFGPGRCAVELFTGDDAATYLYKFNEPAALFRTQLEAAMEAMGPHREIIWQTDEQLAAKPVYRMAVERCPAVTFLRARTAGRIIHNATHAAKLQAFLENGGE